MELLALSPVWVHPLFLRGSQRSDACRAAGDLGSRVLAQSPPRPQLKGSPPHTLERPWERQNDQRWPRGWEPFLLEMQIASVEESF